MSLKLASPLSPIVHSPKSSLLKQKGEGYAVVSIREALLCVGPALVDLRIVAYNRA